MKKKYTMEQFKEMFDKAKVEAIETSTRQATENVKEPLLTLLITMASTDSVMELEKNLFGEGE
jgi:hypothetical protein